MNIGNLLLAAALAASLAGCAHAPATPAVGDPLTLDTHVDIPLDYMRDPRYDAGTETRLQVDLGKMERGGLDAAFFVVYVGQGPLTPEGYADAVAQAERKYSAIHMMVDRYPDRIEREHDAFFERVREAFLERARQEPERFRVVDAARPPDEVAAEALSHLRDYRAGLGP